MHYFWVRAILEFTFFCRDVIGEKEWLPKTGSSESQMPNPVIKPVTLKSFT